MAQKFNSPGEHWRTSIAVRSAKSVVTETTQALTSIIKDILEGDHISASVTTQELVRDGLELDSLRDAIQKGLLEEISRGANQEKMKIPDILRRRNSDNVTDNEPRLKKLRRFNEVQSIQLLKLETAIGDGDLSEAVILIVGRTEPEISLSIEEMKPSMIKGLLTLHDQGKPNLAKYFARILNITGDDIINGIQ